MTGSSFFHRQHSSTAVPNIKSKLATTELRRCWSVDVQSSFESTIDDISEMKFSSTHDPTASDNDSGIEDFDQQPATTVVEPKNNDQTEEMTQFVPTVATDDEEDCIVLAPRKETQSIEEDFTVHTCQLNDEIENFDVNILHRDIERAAAIADEEKKEFCCDTSVVFHGEFARLISCPIELMNPALRYHLIPEYGLDYDPKYFPDCAYVKLDNAKAQFKCQNPDCARLWTTMRARISFKISFPNECGYVYFKIYEQNCQVCGEIAEPLWYMEEVCRVMKNLQEFISQTLVWIPEQYKPLQDNNSPELSVQKRHKPYHSSKQRKGNMKAPHDASLCRACFEGCCFI